MPLKIELTSGWSPERMADVYPSVLVCIRKFVKEFSSEISENAIISEILTGKRQLWVVYDESEPKRAILAVLTETKLNTDTNVRHVEITAIGGERIREALPLLETIEQWAMDEGSTETLVIGRFGWVPLLKERGYSKKAVIMTKRLNRAENDG